MLDRSPLPTVVLATLSATLVLAGCAKQRPPQSTTSTGTDTSERQVGQQHKAGVQGKTAAASSKSHQTDPDNHSGDSQASNPFGHLGSA